MKAHTVKAYNLIFPVYMIMLLSPVLWVFMIIGNFLVDSLVLLATIAILAFTVLSDFYVGMTPYSWPGCALLALPAILTAAILIYILNSRFAFRKTGLSLTICRKLALSLAVFTSPWVMMIPLDAWNAFFQLFGFR